MGAKILLYHMKEEKIKKIQSAVSMMGIAVQPVAEDALGQKIGKLADIHGFEDEASSQWKGEIPEDEMLVMCGFSKVQFDLLMNMFKRGKLPKVDLKAVLTETNQNWTLGKLFGELKTEHAFLHQKKKPGAKSVHREE